MKKLFILLFIGLCLTSTLCAEEALTAKQKEAQKWTESGNAYNSSQQFQNAIEDYTKAIELDPKNPWAYSGRGFAYAYSNQLQEAINDYTKAIELRPPPTLAALNYCSRGDVYHDLGLNQNAKDDYTKAIELDPKHAYAYYGRGSVYVQLGQYHKAEDDFGKAIELNGLSGENIAKTYFIRGALYAAEKLPTAACDDFYQAGLLYLKQNNRTKVLECIDYIKKVDSSSYLIQKLSDKIYGENK